MKTALIKVLILGIVFVLGTSASAGVSNQVARAAAEQAARWAGREAEHEAVATLTRRIERLAAQHGEEVLQAVRKGGPEVLPLIEKAGARGGVVSQLIARQGDAAIRIVRNPELLDLVVRHGEAATLALMRHPTLARPVIGSFGTPAARALTAVGPRGARRLAILAEDGTLTTLGRTEQVLAVVARYGDRAMDFLWRHKGTLIVGTVLTAFLNDPEPFLTGARRLVTDTAGATTQSIVNGARRVVDTPVMPIAQLVMLVSILGIGVLAGTRACGWRRHRL